MTCSNLHCEHLGWKFESSSAAYLLSIVLPEAQEQGSGSGAPDAAVLAELLKQHFAKEESVSEG